MCLYEEAWALKRAWAELSNPGLQAVPCAWALVGCLGILPTCAVQMLEVPRAESAGLRTTSAFMEGAGPEISAQAGDEVILMQEGG